MSRGRLLEPAERTPDGGTMQPEHFAGQAGGPPVDIVGGRYRLSARLLGRGGLADVWAGVDVAQDRPVAIKLFRPGTETAEEQRFAQEARTLSGLSHPHLVSLYDAGDAQGRAYLVMGQVAGGTVAGELQARGSLPVNAVRRMGAQVASALAYIHARGIVHRDVKPANILMDGSGNAVLADFGIARLIDGTRLTSTGLTVGTAAYLSPEQVRGRHVGPPADVYALGLVLLESITGRREYPGDPVEAAIARLYRAPEVPENLQYGFTGLLRAMTAEDPAMRPTASFLYDVLGRAVAAVPSQIRAGAGSAPAAPTKPEFLPARRRRPRALWLAPVAVVIGATAAGLSLIPHGPSDSARTSTPGGAVTATPSAGAAATTPPSVAADNISRAPVPRITAASVLSSATAQRSLAPLPAAGPGPGKGHGNGPGGHGHGHGKGGGKTNGSHH